MSNIDPSVSVGRILEIKSETLKHLMIWFRKEQQETLHRKYEKSNDLIIYNIFIKKKLECLKKT